jgi:hypothetical protein
LLLFGENHKVYIGLVCAVFSMFMSVELEDLGYEMLSRGLYHNLVQFNVTPHALPDLREEDQPPYTLKNNPGCELLVPTTKGMFEFWRAGDDWKGEEGLLALLGNATSTRVLGIEQMEKTMGDVEFDGKGWVLVPVYRDVGASKHPPFTWSMFSYDRDSVDPANQYKQLIRTLEESGGFSRHGVGTHLSTAQYASFEGRVLLTPIVNARGKIVPRFTLWKWDDDQDFDDMFGEPGEKARGLSEDETLVLLREVRAVKGFPVIAPVIGNRFDVYTTLGGN